MLEWLEAFSLLAFLAGAVGGSWGGNGRGSLPAGGLLLVCGWKGAHGGVPKARAGWGGVASSRTSPLLQEEAEGPVELLVVWRAQGFGCQMAL